MFLPFLFWRKKGIEKTWRKLTRTIGLWVFEALWCGGRTIKICLFGSQVPPECCSNKYFRRWMCGFATGVDGWNVWGFYMRQWPEGVLSIKNGSGEMKNYKKRVEQFRDGIAGCSLIGQVRMRLCP